MLNTKVVVITGGAGLLGKVFIEGVLKNNGIAIIADINTEKGTDLKEKLKNEYKTGTIDFVELNVCSKKSVNNAIDHIHKKYGKIDAWVNNAYPKNKNFGNSFFDVEYSDFCENVNMHLGGYFLCSQQIAKFFKGQGFGNIINISSIYGVIAPRFEIYDGTEITTPVEYAVIKAGLIHLTKYMTKYLKGMNIRVNAISPGGILDRQPETFLKQYNINAQNKGMLDPKDIVGTLLFLLSDLSMYVNGQNIIVDDGWTL
jgi:NAD(P)-dependent dehydrogenase (short-subunit alcohol dehydrogenase family)